MSSRPHPSATRHTTHRRGGSYYTVGGVKSGQGVILTRDRNGLHDAWYLNDTESDGWFRLETNYDRDQPVPPMDDRRTPGRAHMRDLGRAGANATSILDSVLKVWPTYNHHTDLTCVMSAATAVYNCMWWSD